MTSAELLSTHDLTKRFGRHTVLRDCSLSFRSGEIHALLGANGAGKSTFVRLLAGLLTPTDGRMQLDGQAYRPADKRSAEASGIEIVQQELNLVPTLSIAENLALNQLPARWGIVRYPQLHQQAAAALKRVGLDHLSPGTPVERLGVGQQQLVEIAAALDRTCRLLILDEPTAALTAGETETLFDWLRELRQQGVCIIFISHRLEEVSAWADRISILRDGQVVGTWPIEDCSADDMVLHMSGPEAASTSAPFQSLVQNDIALQVSQLSGGMVRDVSLEVRSGERLGIAGLIGSGRTELLRLIFGADKATSGQVRTLGRPESDPPRHPSEAVRRGIAMITEDRKQNGLLLPQSIRENMSLAALALRFANRSIIRRAEERDAAEEQTASLDVNCVDIEQAVGTLSGGNQQKVAIARWLIRDAGVFLFDEPTRGIDVAARRRIYRLVEALARQGKGMLIVSSDTEELFEICDRIAVMSNGRLIDSFSRDDWTKDKVMQAAFAGYRQRMSESSGT